MTSVVNSYVSWVCWTFLVDSNCYIVALRSWELCVIFVNVSQSLPLVCRNCTLVVTQRVIGICRLHVPEDDIMYSFVVLIAKWFWVCNSRFTNRFPCWVVYYLRLEDDNGVHPSMTISLLSCLLFTAEYIVRRYTFVMTILCLIGDRLFLHKPVSSIWLIYCCLLTSWPC